MAYVDAQRNMAVAIGERDVKTDVSIKERVVFPAPESPRMMTGVSESFTSVLEYVVR